MASRKDGSLTKTMGWHDLHVWQRDNEYILTGYRRLQNAWPGTFASVYSYVHNETVNIHSHLWGSLLFLYLSSTMHSIMFLIFTLSATACLALSAFYHTASCHSQYIEKRCHALDYTGIVILIVGSFYPCIYYGFYCEPRNQIAYLSLISSLGLLAGYIVLNPEYAKPTHRGTRTGVFIALGMSAVIPVAHWALTRDFHVLFVHMGLQWVVLSGALYIGGALLYANRIPEKWTPGRYDYWGASHQIFHLCVVAAALCHYRSLVVASEYRMSEGHCV